MGNVFFRSKVAYAVEKGTMHVFEGTNCQDSVDSLHEKQVTVLALSDGAGSCLHSEIASECAVNWAVQYFCDNFETLYADMDLDIEVVQSRIAKAGREMFREMKILPDEQYCTLLVVAVHDDGRWLCAHVGDGIIFRIDDEVRVLSYPENGEFCNMTFFLNEEDSEEHLRVQRGVAKEEIGFLLSSDGCANLLYDAEEKKAASAVGIIIGWLHEHDEKDVSEAIHRQLIDLFQKKSEDDLSIGIIYSHKSVDEQI